MALRFGISITTLGGKERFANKNSEKLLFFSEDYETRLKCNEHIAVTGIL